VVFTFRLYLLAPRRAVMPSALSAAAIRSKPSPAALSSRIRASISPRPAVPVLRRALDVLAASPLPQHTVEVALLA